MDLNNWCEQSIQDLYAQHGEAAILRFIFELMRETLRRNRVRWDVNLNISAFIDYDPMDPRLVFFRGLTGGVVLSCQRDLILQVEPKALEAGLVGTPTMECLGTKIKPFSFMIDCQRGDELGVKPLASLPPINLPYRDRLFFTEVRIAPLIWDIPTQKGSYICQVVITLKDGTSFTDWSESARAAFLKSVAEIIDAQIEAGLNPDWGNIM